MLNLKIRNNINQYESMHVAGTFKKNTGIPIFLKPCYIKILEQHVPKHESGRLKR
jgi:hypothetical protein